MLTVKDVKSTPFLNFLCLSFAIFAAIQVEAAPVALPFPEEIDWGTSTYSFSGASAAISYRQDSISTNPAGLVYFQGTSTFGGEYLSMPFNENKWSVSLVDGSNDIIGGTRFSWDNVGDAERQKYSGAFAYKTPYGAIGGAAHIVKFSNVTEGKGWHFTQSLGFIAPIMGGFSIGGYLNSIFDFEKDTHVPPSVHLGAVYVYPQVLKATFDADRRLYLPNEDWNYSVSGDFLFNEYFSARGGYHWAFVEERSFWSVGGALLAPKIELAGFYMRTVGSTPKNGFGFDAYFKF